MTAITLIRGVPVPEHLAAGRFDAQEWGNCGLFLLIQQDDDASPLTWLWQEQTEQEQTEQGQTGRWTIGPSPPGLAFLPSDFDDSDLTFAGYVRIGEIRE